MLRPVTTLLLILTFFLSYAQEDWEMVKEKAKGHISNSNYEAAIELLIKAKEKIANEKGRYHKDYNDCQQQLMAAYMSSGNMNAYMQEVQEMSAATQEAAMERYKQSSEDEISIALQLTEASKQDVPKKNAGQAQATQIVKQIIHETSTSSDVSRQTRAQTGEKTSWLGIHYLIKQLHSSGSHQLAVDSFRDAKGILPDKDEHYYKCLYYVFQSYSALGIKNEEYDQISEEYSQYTMSLLKEENPYYEGISKAVAQGQEYKELLETESRKAELEKSEEFETIRKRLNETGRIKSGPDAEVSGSYITGQMTAMLEGASPEERQEIYDQMLPVYRQMYPDMELPERFTDETFEAFVKSTMTTMFKESEERLDINHEASRKLEFPDNPVVMIDRFDSLIQALQRLEWVYPELVSETKKLMQMPAAETMTDEEAISILVKAAAQAPEKHPYSGEELRQKLVTLLQESKIAKRKFLTAYYPEVKKQYLQYSAMAPSLKDFLSESLNQPGINYLGDIVDFWPLVQQLPLFERGYEVFLAAVENLELKGHGSIDTLRTEANQMEEIAKYRQMHLYFALEAHQEGLNNIFEEGDFSINFNDLLASKGADYKAKKYIIDAVTSGDETIRQKYDRFRARKAELTSIQYLTEEQQQKMGWTPERWATAIKEIRDEYRELYHDLRDLSSFEVHAGKWIIDWQDIRDELEPGEAYVNIERVVDPVEGDRGLTYWAFVIKPETKPALIKLETPGKKLENFDYQRTYLGAIEEGRTDVSSYDIFWAPLSKHLNGVKKVFLSPDGIYHNISFASLYNPLSKQYMADEVEVIRLSDPSDIKYYSQLIPEEDSSIANAHLFGYPSYRLEVVAEDVPTAQKRIFKAYSALSPLPATKVETEKIDSTLSVHGILTTVLLEEYATEEKLCLLKSPDILHIATHGSYAPPKYHATSYSEQKLVDNPMLRTWLNFAGASNTLLGEQPQGPNDGILTSEDILHIDLKGTELVVLSACETGLGEAVSGEGTFNLARSFQLAGAKNVIMSLWTVNDKVTQELMVTLYENWLTKGQPLREAFLAARDQIKQQYPEPKFWAPFVLIGQE